MQDPEAGRQDAYEATLVWEGSPWPVKKRTTTQVMLSALPLWQASCSNLLAASSGFWMDLIMETASWNICTTKQKGIRVENTWKCSRVENTWKCSDHQTQWEEDLLARAKSEDLICNNIPESIACKDKKFKRLINHLFLQFPKQCRQPMSKIK